jgi:hypothetical protein
MLVLGQYWELEAQTWLKLKMRIRAIISGSTFVSKFALLGGLFLGRKYD